MNWKQKQDFETLELEERPVFHVDVNSAFLSWSALKCLEEDPGSVDLRTIPSAVGGDVKMILTVTIKRQRACA